MKSRLEFPVTFDPRTSEVTFPDELNRWPLMDRIVLFNDIAAIIDDRMTA